MSDPVLKARSRVATTARYGTPEANRAARQQLTEAKTERAIQDALAAAPPLTDEQRTRLAALLAGGDAR